VLDENGMMLVNQLQWINVMPGERRVCTGCHGPRERDEDIKHFSVAEDGQVTFSLDQIRTYMSGFNNAQRIMDHAGARPDTVDFLDLGNTAKANTVQKALDNKCSSCHGVSTAPSLGGGLVLENVAHDSLNNTARISSVYSTLTRTGGYVTAKAGTLLSYATSDGARNSPLAWVLYHKQLARTNDVLFRTPSHDHSSLWKKDGNGRIDPFDAENRDLLTLIEWMDMGIQFSNSTGRRIN
jgi:hypothetical protein